MDEPLYGVSMDKPEKVAMVVCGKHQITELVPHGPVPCAFCRLAALEAVAEAARGKVGECPNCLKMRHRCPEVGSAWIMCICLDDGSKALIEALASLRETEKP